MSLNTVTVTWNELDIGQAPLGGYVSFQLSAVEADSTDGLTIESEPAKPYFFTSATGSSDPLVANDNANLAPAGSYYLVTVAIKGQPSYTFKTVVNFANGASQTLAFLYANQAVPAAQFSQYLPLPSGTPVAGDVPIVIANNSTATAWGPNGSGGGGGVSSVSVVTANGFAGTVATPTSTPAITLKTSVTGLLKGNGTAVSAATSGTDYAPATSGSAILKGNGAGGFSSAAAGTDYLAPTGSGAGLTGVVTSVAAGDTSIVIGGTAAAPTVATGTLDVIATDHPPAAAWSNNSKKITSVANGAAAQDAATFGQTPAGGTTVTIGQGGTGQVTQQAALDALAGAVTSAQYLRGNGTHVQMSAIQAADVPTLNQSTTGNAATATNLAGGATLPDYLAPKAVTLSFVGSGTTLVDASLGNAFNLTLTASTTTLGNPSNSVDGEVIRFRITQGAGGSFTLAYGGNYDFGAAGSPTLSTAAAKVDILGFEYVASISKWCYLGSGLGF